MTAKESKRCIFTIHHDIKVSGRWDCQSTIPRLATWAPLAPQEPLSSLSNPKIQLENRLLTVILHSFPCQAAKPASADAEKVGHPMSSGGLPGDV